jgi:soluble lytic murein transglycosylase-like protein
MIKDMYAIMQRIEGIRTRFGLNRPVRSHGKSRDYQEYLAEAIEESVEGRAGKDDDLPGIKGKTVEEIKQIADFYARRNRVPSSLVNAVIETESGFNPKAVSRKGARGLMQLMPSVIKDFNISDAFDPRQNIRAGVELLSGLLKEYNGDYSLALAAYNAGKGKVDRHGGVPEYGETRQYIKKVIDSYLKNSE